MGVAVSCDELLLVISMFIVGQLVCCVQFPLIDVMANYSVPRQRVHILLVKFFLHISAVTTVMADEKCGIF